MLLLLICVVASTFVVLREFLLVLENSEFVSAEYLGLLALRLAEIDQVHDNLLEHKDRNKQTAHVDKLAVDEGCPTHAEVAVKEPESVVLLDERFFMLLLVLLVFLHNQLADEDFELLVKIDDCDRVGDNTDP